MGTNKELRRVGREEGLPLEGRGLRASEPNLQHESKAQLKVEEIHLPTDTPPYSKMHLVSIATVAPRVPPKQQRG